jgi:hypothetical protein
MKLYMRVTYLVHENFASSHILKVNIEWNKIWRTLIYVFPNMKLYMRNIIFDSLQSLKSAVEVNWCITFFLLFKHHRTQLCIRLHAIANYSKR